MSMIIFMILIIMITIKTIAVIAPAQDQTKMAHLPSTAGPRQVPDRFQTISRQASEDGPPVGGRLGAAPSLCMG